VGLRFAGGWVRYPMSLARNKYKAEQVEDLGRLAVREKAEKRFARCLELEVDAFSRSGVG